MVDPDSVQIIFFKRIKAQLERHQSLADEIASVLNLSIDSAYRRIRGEKTLSFDELKILCEHFRFSVDQFLHIRQDSLVFYGKAATAENFHLYQYLEESIRFLRMVNSHEHRELVILVRELPLYHQFYFPELAAFSCFFFMKTLLQLPAYSKSAYNTSDFRISMELAGNRMMKEFSIIPTREIWSEDVILNLLRKIDYYQDMDLFEKKEDLEAILIALEKTVDRIEEQADAGAKLLAGSTKLPTVNYWFYLNDFIPGDNSQLAIIDDKRVCLLNQGGLNYFMTNDSRFCEQAYHHAAHLLRSSELLSRVGEKKRVCFFHSIRDQINARKNAFLH